MNPIIQQLNSSRSSGMIGSLNMLKSIAGNNPNMIFQNMMKNNTQFRQFVESNRNKPAEQIAREYGVNLDEIMSLLK